VREREKKFPIRVWEELDEKIKEIEERNSIKEKNK
jgi:hypothetical protein